MKSILEPKKMTRSKICKRNFQKSIFKIYKLEFNSKILTNEQFELLLIILINIFCYLKSALKAEEFVFDDRVALIENPLIINMKNLNLFKLVKELWRRDFWGQPIGSNFSHKSFRPLTTLTFM